LGNFGFVQSDAHIQQSFGSQRMLVLREEDLEGAQSNQRDG
jgi:hypothetical protein